MWMRFMPFILLDLIPRAISRVKTRLARIFARSPTDDSYTLASVMNASYVNERDVPVLDVGVFRELHVTLGSNTDRVRNVYTKFLDSAAKRIDELRQQPFAASLKTLHALKGSAGMVGASRLAALAAHLQETTADRETLAGGIDDIETELSRFHGVLNAQLDSVSGSVR
jgi:HPt (histidine-containing phosphotransfer) domain-containing protein